MRASRALELRPARRARRAEASRSRDAMPPARVWRCARDVISLQRPPSIPMSSRTLLSLALIAVAGCAGTSPLDTTVQSALAREARAVGPNGLEQRLTVVVDPQDFREPGFHTLGVTSDVFNTGRTTVPVTARVCLFFESDVEITAEADRFEPF